ncbi:NAD-binding Rossmann fold oxidoreductase [Coprinopsis marcescibilis]|uniref:NAD-binding Rossmann fold oxidoreductase n=1 Tax=Coprinopsis marcescibilis TaxID=230819 RepID=A0A5C3KIN3_COPMA|nr:NAD-binding Rossmann fold oxidoreductase [Coprinopsis marcescibilis]
MSTKPLNLGIVGLSTKGWASFAHFPALTSPSLRSKYTIRALHNSSEASAKAAAQTYSQKLSTTKDPSSESESDAMANDSDIDVLAITVKAPDHAPFVYAAISAGKSFMVEYPPGVSLQETQEMKRRLDERAGDVKAMVGLQGRQSATINKVKKLIEMGKIGKVLSTTLIGNVPRELQAWQPATHESFQYALDDKNGATMLAIVGGHTLGTFTHLLGTFTSLNASASVQYPTTTILPNSPPNSSPRNNTPPKAREIPSPSSDHYTISGPLASGAHATLVWRSGYPSSAGRLQLLWVIDGARGSVRLELEQGGAFPGPFMNLQDPRVFVDGELALGEGEKGTLAEFVQREWVEFAKTLGGGKGEYATLDDAIRVQKVVDAAQRSIAMGGVRVDL